ncbi:MAG: type VI secretion system baseplate subunit TssE [Planctomycetes bacterium]|nr:type VI secretion system baseplate subunit TssE [Planctomycetota bacterium]
MSPSASLFERLARPAHAPSAIRDRGALLRSILANLQNLLNTRVGSAAAQMDLGTPAANEIALDFPASLSRLQESIRACIQRYEPRLRAVEVAFVDTARDALLLHFQVTARLVGDEHDGLLFRTTVDPSGRLTIRT